jgi:orotate phosphoribosyltransferase
MSVAPVPDPLAQEFVRFAVEAGVLRFGEFRTKAGRLSPYFFNAGLFDDGAKLGRLAGFYARRLLAARAAGRFDFDLLFGPAYKGITLVAAVAIELARLGHNVPLAYNRKEAKDHGEGGVLVGAPVRGRVLIVDDVISAGTSVNESIQLIRAAGAAPAGVAIALDRQEQATEGGRDVPWSAVDHVQREHGLPVVAVATLTDLLAFLETSGDAALRTHLEPVAAYRARYGVAGAGAARAVER